MARWASSPQERAQALLEAQSIRDSHGRARALEKIVADLTGIGQCEEAETAARSITIPYTQGQALALVATALAAADNANSAKRLAAATCALSRWTIAAAPVLSIEPHAFARLARALDKQP